jgi:hypothetical protein
MKRCAVAVVVLMMASACAADAPRGGAAAAPGAGGAPAPSGPPAEAKPLSSAAREVLQMLEDRKKTLKDFTAKIDYSVEHIAGDVDGKLGRVDYVDGAGGPQFSVDFTTDTVNGKPRHKRHSQIIMDGKDVIGIDFDAKQFSKSPSPPTNSLDSHIPLPIGIKVDDVTANFNVEERPEKVANPDRVTLRLVPRMKGKFEYRHLDVTVDKKLQIPVELQMNRNDEITRIKFLEPDINSGKAKVITPITPDPSKGWTINAGKAGKK